MRFVGPLQFWRMQKDINSNLERKKMFDAESTTISNKKKHKMSLKSWRETKKWKNQNSPSFLDTKLKTVKYQNSGFLKVGKKYLHRGDVFAGKTVCRVGYQHASFSNGTVADNDAFNWPARAHDVESNEKKQIYWGIREMVDHTSKFWRKKNNFVRKLVKSSITLRNYDSNMHHVTFRLLYLL